MNKWRVVLLLFVFIPIILFFTDTIHGKKERIHLEEKVMHVEVGDIIFRSKSYLLASGKYYYKSGMPGHLAIALSEGTFSGTDENMGNIEVIESAMLNRGKRTFQADVAINMAYENFGNCRGIRFLLKMHLNDEQKKQLIILTRNQTGKPYSIFASKNCQDSFNCATFARWALLEVAGFDLDSDEGSIVFPNDILRSSRFDKPGDRILF